MTKLKGLLVVSASAATMMIGQAAFAQTVSDHQTVSDQWVPNLDGTFLNLQDATAAAGNALINDATQENIFAANIYQGTIAGGDGLNLLEQRVGDTPPNFFLGNQDVSNILDATAGGTGNAQITGSMQEATNLSNLVDVTGVEDGVNNELVINQQMLPALLYNNAQAAANTATSEATGTGNAYVGIGQSATNVGIGQSATNIQNVAIVDTGEGELQNLDITQRFGGLSEQDALNTIDAMGRNAQIQLGEGTGEGQSAVNLANIASANGEVTGSFELFQTSEFVLAGPPTQDAFNVATATGVNNALISGSEAEDGQSAINALNVFSSENLGGLGTNQSFEQFAIVDAQSGGNTAIAMGATSQISGLMQSTANVVNSITTTNGD